MADEKTPPAAPAADAKPAAKAPKKEKPPALEDKPFTEFIQQHFLPSLEAALKDKGMGDVTLSFAQQPLTVFGITDGEAYWQVKGQWLGDSRQFTIAFTKDSISSPKLFYLADGGSEPSTIEQFMGDERKITLDLMVLYTLQRLNGQKWLVRN
ncbi:hypothetical protein GFS31_09190 [Leptolyngbya sp. BL0902]|uniref:DUF2996 domain-containing protein n=1 Tax=Leptolyngbya sp. BL0902 TaxID=1115757 RepID=UPI0018E8CFEC|nr:DUF2996 domain-containing protein [Leptolyngbya sp. BL0902]QQE64239.1 hypothetical protein GFS31_09190 [Leptolyngbya sp. BL0902]